MGGRKQLRRGDPVIVDIVGGCAGYIADGTRVYSLGPLSQELRDAHTFLLDLNSWIEEQLRPGRIPEEIYNSILERVAKSPYGAQFMGAGENQVKFVAHSVGLELDEIPVIAPKYDVPFEANTVMAVEPKIFFPGVGGVGTENTYVIREGPPERLISCPPGNLRGVAECRGITLSFDVWLCTQLPAARMLTPVYGKHDDVISEHPEISGVRKTPENGPPGFTACDWKSQWIINDSQEGVCRTTPLRIPSHDPDLALRLPDAIEGGRPF